MQIKIEKNIPLRADNNRGEVRAVLPLMEVGDSFALPVKDKDYKRVYARVWASFKAKGLRCAIRKVSKNKMRVWRVK